MLRRHCRATRRAVQALAVPVLARVQAERAVAARVEHVLVAAEGTRQRVQLVALAAIAVEWDVLVHCCCGLIVGRDVDTARVLCAGRVELALVDVVLAEATGVAGVAEALEVGEHVDAQAVVAARSGGALVDVELAVSARVAGRALAPVASRSRVVQLLFTSGDGIVVVKGEEKLEVRVARLVGVGCC